MINDLLPFFPTHHTYVEVFGGAAHLLCAKPPSAFEVYNDIDSGLVNFFKVIADESSFKRFYRKASLLPHSRGLFHELRDEGLYESDPVERAVAWFYVMRHAMSAGGSAGRHSKWGYSTNTKHNKPLGHDYLKAVDLLPELRERLKHVQIDHRDFRRVFKAYDDSDTFFYCDPTYLLETQLNYAKRNDKRGHTHVLSMEDHEALLQLVRTLKGKVLLSHYPHSLYDILVTEGWDVIKVPKAVHSQGMTRGTGRGQTVQRKDYRIECIYRNPAAVASAGQQMALAI